MKTQDTEKGLSFAVIQKSDNLVSELDDSQLMGIARQVIEGYQLDEESRLEWLTVVNKVSKIINDASQAEKSFPWPKASNIKYPLIKQAAIDYASRTLPEVIQVDKIVKAKVIGSSYPQQQPPMQQPQPGSMDQPQQMQQQQQPEMVQNGKTERAKRVSDFMSNQLLCSPDWEDGMDKLLQLLPIYGTIFKKTYYSEIDKRTKSDLCIPGRIVVNYGVQSLETAPRITHKITLYRNDIIERQRRRIYNSDFEIENVKGFTVADNTEDPTSASQADIRDTNYPVDLLEQQCWLDLDKDDYLEPYIVTVHEETQKVLRIVSCIESVEKKEDKIICIKSCQYYTDYHFIRSFDGGFYSVGFGSLLLSLNKSINALINQLLDAGTLSNTRGGFLGRGLRLKNGEYKFTLNQFKVLDAVSVGKISDHIYEFPRHEPSETLYKLLGLLMQVGKDLTSSTDALKGQQPAQNVSTGTLGQLIEQGTKMFTAINKRVYRSLKKEYKKLYDLNYKFLSQKEYKNVLDDPMADVKKDFEPESMDILPVADPTLSSDQQRLNRMNIIQQLQSVDRREADRLVLESIGLDQEMINRLLPAPDPEAPPPPEVQKIVAETEKLKGELAQISANATLSAQKLQLEMAQIQQGNKESEARIQESIGRVWKMQNDAMVNMKKLETVKQKMQFEEQIKSSNAANTVLKTTADAQLKADLQEHQKQMDVGSFALKSTELSLKDKEVKAKTKTEDEKDGD